MLRGRPLPKAAKVERSAVEPERPQRGVAAGVGGPAGAPVTVTLDVAAGSVSDGKKTVKVDARQDPLTPGVVGVDDGGAQALVMASRGMHKDPALVLVDLRTERATVVHAFDGPGWVAGGFCSGDVVVCEQVLGDAPRYSLLVKGRRVLSVEGMQAPCVPVEIDDHMVAVLLCLRPDPMTFTGPTSLCVVDLQSGAAVPLAPAAGTRVSRAGGAVVVEGGAERVVVTLAA